MENEIKRVNYFNRQFLRAAEFQDDQSYHMGLRRLHNESMHTRGVVSGLDVGVDYKTGRLTISKGMAIDVLGREVLLQNDTSVSLNSIKEGYYIYIKYGENLTEFSNDPGVKNIPTRCQEISKIICTEADLTEENEVLLAKMEIVSGKFQADNSVRTKAGSLIPDTSDLTVHSLTFKTDYDASKELPKFVSEEEGVLSLEASKYLIKGKEGKPTQLILKNTGKGKDASIFVSTQKSQDSFLTFGVDVLRNRAVIDVGSEASELMLRHLGKGQITFYTNNAEQVVIDSEGNVGIGTNTPDDKLDIEGDIRINDKTLWLRNGKDKLHGLGFRGVLNGEDNLFSKFNVNGPALFGCEGGILGTTGDGEKIILSWRNSGNVGIGITDPPQQLSITEGIGFANHNAQDKKLYSPEDGLLEWMTHDNAAAHGFAISHQGDKRVLLSTDGNSYIKNGNVGIGTDEPQDKLDVEGNIRINDSTIWLRKDTDQYHGLGYRGNPTIGEKPFADFNVNGPALFGCSGGVLGTSWGGEKIILSWRNSGNVGIGTNEPDDKLDVEGDIRINDSTLWLRSQTDKNHGLGWFGEGKRFADRNIDGPVLFGCSGGALGIHNNGEKVALSWDTEGKIGIGVEKPLGKLQVDNGAVIIGNPIGDAQFWADKIKWGGLYICQNPADNGAKAIARLTLHNRGKDNKPHEWAFYTASYQGAWGVEPNALEIWEYKEGVAKEGISRLKILPGGDIQLLPNGGNLKIYGDTRIYDSSIWLRRDDDKNHGLGWFGSGKLFANQNVDGPVLFGCSGGALGSHSEEDNISLSWDNKGNVTVAGDLNVGGKLLPQGLKGGFVADQFINNLGESLEEGDVIIIGSNQASLYYGQNGSIPIPEVDLASTSYDTKVCGIVCDVVKDSSQNSDKKTENLELVEAKGKKKTRKTVVSQEVDKITVAPGQKGYMVTLGTYAYCKVDAKYGAIEVGDLLTTSPTKGHAMKVTDPSKALGTIIGKALGTIKRGKGKIPVLVSLQ